MNLLKEIEIESILGRNKGSEEEVNCEGNSLAFSQKYSFLPPEEDIYS